MNKPTVLTGRVWVIKDKNGNGINDIDTDMIYHNAYLAVTDINKMGQYSFDNLDGWKDFAQKVREGDILVVGKNFGSGSSRQQAVDCFRANGIQLIIGESFGAIYKRNVINSGMPLLINPEIMTSNLETGDEIEVNLVTGELKNLTKNSSISGTQPMAEVQLNIYEAGDLFSFAK